MYTLQYRLLNTVLISLDCPISQPPISNFKPPWGLAFLQPKAWEHPHLHISTNRSTFPTPKSYQHSHTLDILQYCAPNNVEKSGNWFVFLPACIWTPVDQNIMSCVPLHVFVPGLIRRSFEVAKYGCSRYQTQAFQSWLPQYWV